MFRLKWLLLMAAMAMPACQPHRHDTTHRSHHHPEHQHHEPWSDRSARHPLVVGPDTTVIDRPRLPSGLIDYASAINQHFASGVDLAGNPALGLYCMIPDDKWPDEKSRLKAFKQMDHRPPDPEHRRFDSYDAWLARHAPEMLAPDRIAATRDAWNRAGREPWTTEDRPIIAKYLEAQRRGLETLQALDPEVTAFIPLIADPSQVLLTRTERFSATRHFRNVAQALSREIGLLIGEGRLDDAADTIAALRALGVLLADRSPQLIDRIVGMSIANDAASWLPPLLEHPDLTEAVIGRLRWSAADELRLVRVDAAILITERYILLDAIQRMHGGHDGLTLEMLTGSHQDHGHHHEHGYHHEHEHSGAQSKVVLRYFDRNHAMREINRYFAELAEILKDDDLNQRRRKLEDLMRARLALSRDRLREYLGDAPLESSNLQLVRFTDELLETLEHGRRSERINAEAALNTIITELFLGITLPTYHATARIAQQTLARQRMARIATGLAAFHLRHGRFPQALDELMPDILTTMPIDPFRDDDRVLDYRLRDGVATVSSIGTDSDGRPLSITLDRGDRGD
ncbi:MAG: hypothetical protein JJU36_11660 [Phycisphaeraceae bacterium]|nr:hypothetical protein [Phycisphaeraceae bacterium]